MEIKIIYIANDGTEFEDEMSCKRYEYEAEEKRRYLIHQEYLRQELENSYKRQSHEGAK